MGKFLEMQCCLIYVSGEVDALLFFIYESVSMLDALCIFIPSII